MGLALVSTGAEIRIWNGPGPTLYNTSSQIVRFSVATAPPLVTQTCPSTKTASVPLSLVTAIVYVDVPLSPVNMFRVAGAADLSIVQWNVRVQCPAAVL